MGSKRKTTSNGSDNAGKEENKLLIKDERFSKAHYDPRFQNVPKNKAKIQVDSRFNTMFTNKNFGATSSAAVDKRGKPKVRSENELLRYYHSEGDAEAAANKKTKLMMMMKKRKLEEEEESECSESSSEESSESELEAEATNATDTDTDDDELVGDYDYYDDDDVELEDVPVIEKETHRLAVVNMDWSQVKAVDLFVVLRSRLPKRGEIKSVAVYPSDFGIQRMEEEAVRGPVALFENEQYKDKGDSDETSDNDNDDEDEIDNEKLRAYQISRLRYYYAVVECDSVATADYLYKACNGIEFERSSNVLDLRFIPDSMEFKHQPRDVATQAPAQYEGLDFQTRAMQQSKTFISWDDDEPNRVKTLRRNFSEEELAEIESSEFLATYESESDENETGDQDPSERKKKKAKIYRALCDDPHIRTLSFLYAYVISLPCTFLV